MRRVVFAGIALAALVPIAALAQRFDPKRPVNFTVGAPRGPVATERLDAHRSGSTNAQLPTGRLKMIWHHASGGLISEPPLLVGSDVVLVAGRGDVVFLDSKIGDEISRVSIGASPLGPATALSDGTIVLVVDTNDAIGVRKDGITFRTRLAGGRGGDTSPLSLDDGGAVVVTGSELAALDSRGGIRARASLPEPVDGSLLAARGRILAVTTSGVVFGWIPGRDPERLGSFGGRAYGGATLSDDHTILGVVDGDRVMALDLARGVAAPRDTSSGLLFLGPVSVHADTAFFLAKGPGRTYLLGVDRAGQETIHVPIVQGQIPLLIDGGVAPPTIGGHAPLVIDKSGNVAYAIEDEIGVVDASGSPWHLGTSLCRSHSSDLLGIAPNGLAGVDAGFIVACEDGAVALIGARP
ncbi:MAG: hypothetical protein ABI183_22030 [Polyangiaceae bacterium]